MEDDSINFGSDTAGATPGSNSILAQPPLPEEASPGQQGDSNEGEGQTAEGMHSHCLSHLNV
jgi:SWI/SNF related-matrix-associated actin-dependent regulator of chromatin subfamily C